PGRSFRAWLKTVTLNKHRENQRRRAPVLAPEAALDGVASEAEPFWEAEYRGHLMARALGVMRDEFQPATWQALWSGVVEAPSGAEVAPGLGPSVNAVYVARSRVLRRPRDEMAGLLD